MSVPRLTYDRTCFYLDGVPTPLISGEFHYFRVPHDAWRERLVLLKESGANAVATYIPWIVHEPEEGKILFDDVPQRRLNEFLSICEELELMVIARPGPYSYSELRRDGLPLWLADKYPQILAHGPNGEKNEVNKDGSYLHPIFLEKARRWIRAADEAMRPHLYSNGGCIVSVQADNEIAGLHIWRGYLDCNEEAMGFGQKGGHYPRFLEQKYGEISLLNQRYGTGFTSFEDVFPFRNTPGDETVGGKRFRTDYMNFYRETLELYIRTLREWFTEDGIDADLCVNAGSPNLIPLMRNIPAQNKEQNLLLGVDHYYALFPKAGISMTPEKTALYHVSLDLLEALGMPSSVLELQSGSASCYPPILPQNLREFYMTHVALGMKGSNYYVFTGGPNFEDTGSNTEIYDYHAPVAADGTVRPLYHTQKQRNEYSLNNRWLLTAKRVCDLQFGFSWEAEQEGCVSVWKRYSRDGLNLHAYNQSLQLTLDLSGRLFRCKEIGGALDPKIPLLVTCDQRMAREKQQALIDFVRRGGNLLLTPVIPDLDEDYIPCTLLRDFLGVRDTRARQVISPAVLQSGEKVYELRSAFAFPGFGGDVLARDGAGEPIALHKRIGAGQAVLLGATFAYSQFCQMDLLNACIDVFGVPRRVISDCPHLPVTLFEDGRRAICFLINNLTDEVSASLTVTANGKTHRINKVTVPPLTVLPVLLD